MGEGGKGLFGTCKNRNSGRERLSIRAWGQEGNHRQEGTAGAQSLEASLPSVATHGWLQPEKPEYWMPVSFLELLVPSISSFLKYFSVGCLREYLGSGFEQLLEIVPEAGSS